jgi:hypothetical protein
VSNAFCKIRFAQTDWHMPTSFMVQKALAKMHLLWNLPAQSTVRPVHLMHADRALAAKNSKRFSIPM